MIHRKRRIKHRGFSLIELLVVIAIIAILATVLMAAVRKGIQEAQKARASSHMRQIIIAYTDYIHGRNGDLGTIIVSEGGTAHDWIAELAKRDYLNDPRLVAFDFDPLVRKFSSAGFFLPFLHFFGIAMPANVRQIWNKSHNTFGDGFRDAPLSLCFVSGLDNRQATSQTPLMWTRGLNNSGTWNPTEGTTGDGHDGGIWGSDGGLVGFVGIRVEWRESLMLDPPPKWDGSGTTANVWETLNLDAEVFDHRGKINDDGSSSPGSGGETDGETPPSAPGESGDDDEGDGISYDPSGDNEEWWRANLSNSAILDGAQWGIIWWANGAISGTDQGLFNALGWLLAAGPGPGSYECMESAMNNLLTYFLAGNHPELNILPEEFTIGALSTPKQNIIDELKESLATKKIGLTATEMDDYNACTNLFGELFPVLQEITVGEDYEKPKDKNEYKGSSDPYYVAAYNYIAEHASDFNPPSKGHVLAIASLAVEFADIHLNQSES
jgi:prepilin-type N-terminal cleavage/methylation domain-containing protein